MRRFLIAGNWKMNNLKKDNEDLIKMLNEAAIDFNNTGMYLCIYMFYRNYKYPLFINLLSKLQIYKNKTSKSNIF